MIDLFTSTQGLLREAGFTTHIVSVGRWSVALFEDEVVTGFGCVFDTAERLLSEWAPLESSFLKQYAVDLRAAGGKAWNVYCVLLSSATEDSNRAREVSWIEENLDRTRKIAACNIATREDLVHALLPILPLQYQPLLRAEDVSERLLGRIRSIAPGISEAILDDSIAADDVVGLLEESV